MPRRGVFALGAAFALLVSSCLSPTLPLPPPAQPEVTQVGQGQYALTGTIPEPGTVLVLNERTELIYGQVTDRSYRVVVAAEPGDFFLVWYEASLEASTSRRVRIPKTSDAPDGGAVPPDAN